MSYERWRVTLGHVDSVDAIFRGGEKKAKAWYERWRASLLPGQTVQLIRPDGKTEWAESYESPRSSVADAKVPRPEWVTCIRHELGPFADETPSLAPLAGMTWCGRVDHGFVFAGLAHAAYNGIRQGRLVACSECVNAAVQALRHGL